MLSPDGGSEYCCSVLKGRHFAGLLDHPTVSFGSEFPSLFIDCLTNAHDSAKRSVCGKSVPGRQGHTIVNCQRSGLTPCQLLQSADKDWSPRIHFDVLGNADRIHPIAFWVADNLLTLSLEVSRPQARTRLEPLASIGLPATPTSHRFRSALLPEADVAVARMRVR